jgi:protein-S-isoprenylcysteine O-methyltransferase Ste14
VFLQFAGIALLIFSESPIAKGYLIIPEAAGILLAIWAVWVMRRSKLTAMPEPHPDGKIIANGPYSIIRHPMYASLFLVFIPLVISYPSAGRIIILIIFTVNQIAKLLYEEKLIQKMYPEYDAYAKKTWRIIPILF